MEDYCGTFHFKGIPITLGVHYDEIRYNFFTLIMKLFMK